MFVYRFWTELDFADADAGAALHLLPPLERIRQSTMDGCALKSGQMPTRADL
jgi:hypothetical protein